jgi:hypothetical protein
VYSERIHIHLLRPTANYQVLQVPYGMFGPYDWSGSLENILKRLLNIIDKNKFQTVSKVVFFAFDV